MGGPATVLIVDDDDLVRRAFGLVLERGGFRVRAATTGEEGLQLVQVARPDVVLLDLRMPGLDGLEVLCRLVDQAPELPVIVVSGGATLGDAVEALRRGAWDFVVKPVYDNELLVRAVARALEKAELRRQNHAYRENLEQANRALGDALAELRAEAEAAGALQAHLLPPDGLSLGGFVASRRLFPAQVLSGDFVDYFALPEGHAGFYVADVSGHGAASAFVTAILTTLVGKYRQALADGGDRSALDPPEMLARLDRDLAQLGLEKHVTMFYGVIALQARQLRYANAGFYPFPLVWDGVSARELECRGRPLGLPGAGGFGAGDAALTAEARLLVASDGVLELGPERPGRVRREELRQIFARTSDVEALAAALGLRAGVPLRDDVALLFLKGEGSHA